MTNEPTVRITTEWLEQRIQEILLSSWRTCTRRKKGYIYLFRGDGVCKIGQAVNVVMRLRGVSTAAPFPVALIHTIATDNMDMLEKMLHACFMVAGKHVHNEWFRLNEADIQIVIELGDRVVQAQFEDVFSTVRRRLPELAEKVST